MSLTVTDVSNPACLAVELWRSDTERWRLTWDSDDGETWAESWDATRSRWTPPIKVVRPERFGELPEPADNRTHQFLAWNAWVRAYVAAFETELAEEER